MSSSELQVGPRFVVEVVEPGDIQVGDRVWFEPMGFQEVSRLQRRGADKEPVADFPGGSRFLSRSETWLRVVVGMRRVEVEGRGLVVDESGEFWEPESDEPVE